jgi:hypothetical protein
MTGPTGVPVPGSTEYYSYKTLPATGSTSCSASSPIPTTIETTGAAAGSFRAEFSGSSGPITRTIVAQFQPPSFLNYIYFTNFEILDPAATGDSLTTCSTYYWAAPPASDPNQSAWGPQRDAACGGPINFITGDSLHGPLHSNDDLAICGTPSFGSTSPSSPDTVETPAMVNPSNCANAPVVNGTVNGTYNNTVGTVQLPANNAQLLQVADGSTSTHNSGCYPGAGCVFTGPTTIVLNGSANTMTITNATYAGPNPVPWPSNGVVYVANSSCSATYSPTNVTYGNDAGCGDATVSGTYSSSLTIGADNDIMINGSITQTGLSTPAAAPSGSALLGLIANDFVRVTHPCSTSSGNTTTGVYSPLTNPVIDAAILALNHSFIVDNFQCGSPLGTLTVWGAIAQNFRGPVGTESGGSVYSGYVKSYNYDPRLQTLSPPSFLNPVTDWSVDRVTECGDASGAC